jgi:AcrR family transcriptional regulator
MAHASYIREKARSMRIERQLTIDQLAERLALSRSTVYYWVRDLPVPVEMSRSARRQLARRRATAAMQRRFKSLRDRAYEEGLASFHELVKEPTFRDFVCLYIAEGYKRNRNKVSIANSDSAVLVVAMLWLRRLSQKLPTCSIQYHADQDLRELRAFWGKALDVDPDAIRMQRKSNSKQLEGRTWRSRYGVLTICVNDTLLRARLQAWIDCLSQEWLDLGPDGA